MKAGVVVRLPDGREGTVVYNGLDGRGIKWGRHEVTTEIIEKAMGYQNPLFGEPPALYPWLPDAMLRDPYTGCDKGIEYVGSQFEVVDLSESE